MFTHVGQEECVVVEARRLGAIVCKLELKMVATEEEVLEEFVSVESFAQKSELPPALHGDAVERFFSGEKLVEWYMHCRRACAEKDLPQA